ncbi:putative NAD(P)-binding domain-containing protein [Seiridium cardinale]
MAPNVFLTGVTGFVGGEAFYQLYSKHPDFVYTLLLRDESRGELFRKKYPPKENIHLVYGTLDAEDVIEKAAAAADVVVHTAESADDEPSARAILKGLASGHTTEKPGYWIHVSGTMLIAGLDKSEDKKFRRDTLHDVDDVILITEELPDKCIHRPIDKLVLAANKTTSGSVKTLIVCPPTIYGQGRGPVNQNSMQVPWLIRDTLTQGYAPILPPGTAEWDHVHVSDLGAFFVLAVEAALDPVKRADPEIFGPHAYYFLESGAHVWSDIARSIALNAEEKGLLTDETKPHVREVTEKEVGHPSWEFHSHGIAARARQHLGWEPKGKSLVETIPETIDIEWEKLKHK